VIPSVKNFHEEQLNSSRFPVFPVFPGFSEVVECLQCFDDVGWAAGRASGLKKNEW